MASRSPPYPGNGRARIAVARVGLGVGIEFAQLASGYRTFSWATWRQRSGRHPRLALGATGCRICCRSQSALPQPIRAVDGQAVLVGIPTRMPAADSGVRMFDSSASIAEHRGEASYPGRLPRCRLRERPAESRAFAHSESHDQDTSRALSVLCQASAGDPRIRLPCRRRAIATNPINPDPNSQTAAGIGTATAPFVPNVNTTSEITAAG